MTGSLPPTGRCYRCLRPVRSCYCASLPTVPTRTRVVILQHPHERTHPFGTARLVGLCMPNARVHVAHGDRTGELRHELPLPPDAAVLYPHPDAIDVDELPGAERPSTLLALDGTWAHARRLWKDNPWLQRFRHLRLRPAEPSRYRIRREPRDDYVSTLEAIVSALGVLEPENDRLPELVDAFDRMIDQQLAHMHSVPRVGRTHRPRQGASRALSPLLFDERLVIAYAESSLPGGDAASSPRTGARELVQWAAVRLATGESFEALLRPGGPGPSDAHLAHMGLTRADLAAGEDVATARTRFATFLAAGSPVGAWTPTTLAWGAPLLPPDTPTTVLKTSYCNLRNRRAGYLEEVVAREGLATVPIECRGRASQRLGAALAVARRLSC